MKIKEIFDKKKLTFSFEFFPPKDEITAVEFGINVGQLMKLEPSFVSVTYGAGGSTQEKTFNIVDLFQNKLGLTTMAHYTCVNATKEKVKQDLDLLYSKNIENLMLLRGDPPKGQTNFVAASEDFRFGSDLVAFAKEMDKFGIAAAAYPEKHIEANSLEEDLQKLKLKVDAGADFLMTQMFFVNQNYFDFVAEAKEIGIEKRIIPGLIPITNYSQVKRFAQMTGAIIPKELTDKLESVKDNPEKVYQVGMDFAIQQSIDLLKGGAPGIHFYTLNKSRAVVEIYETVVKSIRDIDQMEFNW